MISKTIAKLRDLEYRKAYVSSQINIGIPFQIRALMKSRGWTQESLAERTGMLQPRISAIQTPGKVRPNIETLRRVAEAFDCAFVVRFVPYSELVFWSEQFDPETFNVPGFEEEMEAAANVGERHAATATSIFALPMPDANYSQPQSKELENSYTPSGLTDEPSSAKVVLPPSSPTSQEFDLRV